MANGLVIFGKFPENPTISVLYFSHLQVRVRWTIAIRIPDGEKDKTFTCLKSRGLPLEM
jgi:hypothetical protein